MNFSPSVISKKMKSHSISKKATTKLFSLSLKSVEFSTKELLFEASNLKTRYVSVFDFYNSDIPVNKWIFFSAVHDF